jgi:hypothetical protein
MLRYNLFPYHIIQFISWTRFGLQCIGPCPHESTCSSWAVSKIHEVVTDQIKDIARKQERTNDCTRRKAKTWHDVELEGVGPCFEVDG